MKKYYEILQISPKTEQLVIAAAYERLAQTYHRDVIRNPNTARMVEINEAYEVLSDSTRRSEYDRVFRTRYPSQEAIKGKKRSGVADELTRRRVPYDMATQIVNKIFEYRSELGREESGWTIGCNLLMLIVGFYKWLTS